MAPVQRPKFFEEQYLGAEDLTATVDYARTQQARFALGAHTWGIAAGVELKETPILGGGVAVYLLPGYAWDGYGRPIVVLSPFRIPEDKFAQFTFDPAIDSGGTGRLIPIWLRYEEKETAYTKTVSEFCDPYNRSTRIQETFAIEIGNRNENELTSGVNLAGRLANPKNALQEFDASAAAVYDESIPFQNFPDSSIKARWLIPVGFVRWLPVLNQLGHFIPRDDSGNDPDSDKIRRARRYVGIVAEQIEAADGAIRLRNRSIDPANSSFKPLSQNASENDLVWIEGNIRVEGDNRVCGGAVDFRNGGGENFDAPMRVLRTDTGPDDRALNVLIGRKTQPSNRFAVGVQDGDKIEDKFVVLSGGNVGIGTRNPTDHLQIVGDLRISGQARKSGGGGWTIISDARLKRNLEAISGALDMLLQLRGVRFEWIEPGKMGNVSGPQFGLIAQEVEKVFPEWVSKGPDGYRELTMNGFESLVIEALRDLKTELEELKSSLTSSKPAAGPRKKSSRSGTKQPATKA